IGVLVRHARAVTRAARDGPAVAPHAELHPLQPRRGKHRGGSRRVGDEAPRSRRKAPFPGATVREASLSTPQLHNAQLPINCQGPTPKGSARFSWLGSFGSWILVVDWELGIAWLGIDTRSGVRCGS